MYTLVVQKSVGASEVALYSTGGGSVHHLEPAGSGEMEELGGVVRRRWPRAADGDDKAATSDGRATTCSVRLDAPCPGPGLELLAPGGVGMPRWCGAAPVPHGPRWRYGGWLPGSWGCGIVGATCYSCSTLHPPLLRRRPVLLLPPPDPPLLFLAR